MDTDIEARIRARAYAIWEKEGRPSGRAIDHWLQAAEEIAREEGRLGPAGPMRDDDLPGGPEPGP